MICIKEKSWKSYAQADNAIDAEGSSWVNIDIETLLAANPDYVFIEEQVL